MYWSLLTSSTGNVTSVMKSTLKGTALGMEYIVDKTQETIKSQVETSFSRM